MSENGHEAKPCRVCAEDIKSSARKCVHCGSWQDWRSNLGLSTEVLSLLVALVAVLPATLHYIQTLSIPKEPSLRIGYVRSTEKTIQIQAINEGQIPATIDLAALWVNDKLKWGLNLKTSQSEGALPPIVRASTSEFIDLLPAGGLPRPDKESFGRAYHEKCWVVIKYTGSDGEWKTAVSPWFSCMAVITFLGENTEEWPDDIK